RDMSVISKNCPGRYLYVRQSALSHKIFFSNMPLHVLLTKYIVRTEEKVNKSNLKTYCKSCIEELGDEEGRKTWFPNKTDRIIQHLKKCSHFLAKTNKE